MIIRTFSDQETKTVRENYETLFNQTGEKPVLVPYRLKEIWITLDDEEKDLVVTLLDNLDELAVVRGFYSVNECREYAKKVVEAAGLPEDCIDGDVQDVEPEEAEEVPTKEARANDKQKKIPLDVMNAFVEKQELYRVLTYLCQQYKKIYDNTINIEDRKELADQLKELHATMYERLNKEPNGKLVMELWRELRLSMRFQTIRDNYLTEKGLDDDFLMYECVGHMDYDLEKSFAESLEPGIEAEIESHMV